MAKIQDKINQLEKIKKEGFQKYSSEEIEELVNKRLERKLKDGRSNTVNLPYERTRIDGDIGMLERLKAKTASKTIQEKDDIMILQNTETKLKYLYHLKSMVDAAVEQLRIQNTRSIQLENGQKKSIEEVEAELAMREWM